MPSPVYSVQQLVADDTFLAYVLRTDPQAIAQWESWMAQHPEQAETVEEAVRLIQWLAMRPEPIAEFTIEQEAMKLQARLQAQLGESKDIAGDYASEQLPFEPVSRRNWLGWAASIALLLLASAATWFLFIRVETLTYQTASDESRMILLPDSSVVFLGENSQLRFQEKWSAKATREVWLEGDAYFHVLPKSVPGGVKFQVHAANTLIEVLGTRFNVWNRNRQPRVVLNSGKVKVKMETTPDSLAVFMQPGEMVEVKKDGTELVRTSTSIQKYPPQKGNKIVFNKTPVREIAMVIEEYYGLKVRLQEPSIAELRITGTLPTNNETSFLKALSVILNVDIVRQTDNRILFKYNR